jgi:hypothetical protein
MPLAGTVESAGQADILGLDFNADGQTLTPKLAKAFRDANYRFCVRYVPREASAVTVKFDLKRAEAEALLEAGFAIMAVQHFKSAAGWTPTPDLGNRYGEFAAEWARDEIGLPEGVCVFLDLEAVKSGTPKQDILDYCINWHDQVKGAGYAPGIYLGDRAGVADKEVASNLPFKHCWAAFNETFKVPGRGIQLKQVALRADSPHRPAAAKGFRFQADVTRIDETGGTVKWLAPG